MDEDEALSHVTEVTVSASEKKQLDRYEPAEAHVSYTAEVPEGVDPKDLQQRLVRLATEEAKLQVMERYESYIRKDMDSDDE